MEKITYPRLLRRVQAVLIDSLILSVVVIGSVSLSGALDFEEAWIKAAFLLLPIFILEPLMVSYSGGTIGHHILKLKVRNIKSDNNINIFLACIRFVLKSVLGWFSLVLVMVTKRHQAIHDILISSIVVNKKNNDLPDHESLAERVIEESGYTYPTKILRLFMILVYWIISTVIVLIAFATIQFVECSNASWCTLGVQVGVVLFNITWLFSLALTVIYCWRSRLYGCRRKAIEKNHV